MAIISPFFCSLTPCFVASACRGSSSPITFRHSRLPTPMKVWSGIQSLPRVIFYRVTEPAENSAWEYLGGEPCVRCGLGLREIEKEGR